VVQESVAKRINEMIEVHSKHIDDVSPERKKERGIATVACLVGAIVMARCVNDEPTAQSYLEATRNQLLANQAAMASKPLRKANPSQPDLIKSASRVSIIAESGLRRAHNRFRLRLTGSPKTWIRPPQLGPTDQASSLAMVEQYRFSGLNYLRRADAPLSPQCSLPKPIP
jgi:hypothetical protein